MPYTAQWFQTPSVPAPSILPAQQQQQQHQFNVHQLNHHQQPQQQPQHQQITSVPSAPAPQQQLRDAEKTVLLVSNLNDKVCNTLVAYVFF